MKNDIITVNKQNCGLTAIYVYCCLIGSGPSWS